MTTPALGKRNSLRFTHHGESIHLRSVTSLASVCVCEGEEERYIYHDNPCTRLKNTQWEDKKTRILSNDITCVVTRGIRDLNSWRILGGNLGQEVSGLCLHMH